MIFLSLVSLPDVVHAVRASSSPGSHTCGAAFVRRTVGRAKALRRCRRMAGHEWAGFWVREERFTASCSDSQSQISLSHGELFRLSQTDCSAISLSDAGQIHKSSHLPLFSLHGAVSTHARSKPIRTLFEQSPSVELINCMNEPLSPSFCASAPIEFTDRSRGGLHSSLDCACPVTHFLDRTRYELTALPTLKRALARIYKLSSFPRPTLFTVAGFTMLIDRY